MSNRQKATVLKGGLTLIPLPGFEEIADVLKNRIEEWRDQTLPDGGYTPVDIATAVWNMFPSGESDPQLGRDHIDGHNCYLIGSGPGTDEARSRLLEALHYANGRKARHISVCLGYMMHARSDRDEGQKVLAYFTIFVKLVEAMAGPNLMRLLAADIHSENVTVSTNEPGRITNICFLTDVLQPALVRAHDEGYRVVLAYPDDGARKRYQKKVRALAKKLGIAVDEVIGCKDHDDEQEQTTIRYVVGDTNEVNGSLVIVVDDEIASGGTMIKFANRLIKEFGATDVWAVVTHAVFSGKAVASFTAEGCPITQIFTSDTIPDPTGRLSPLRHGKRLTTISWLPRLAEAIYRDHHGLSIRED